MEPIESDAREEILRNVPQVLPILPLRNTVVYPFAVVPIQVGQERSVRLIDEVMRGSRLLGLVTQTRGEVESAGPADLYPIGTAARILQLLRRPEGGLMVAVQGLERIRTVEFVSEQPYLTARIEIHPDQVERTPEVEALRRHIVEQFTRVVELASYLPAEAATVVTNLEDPLQTAYFVAASLQLSVADRQAILEIDRLREKLERLDTLLQREREVLEVGQQIREQAQGELAKTQREYILREQLRAIRRELGEEQDEAGDTDEFRRRIEEAGLPPEARKEADRELARLARLNPASPEYGIIRTYLDWVSSLPWSKSSGGTIDIAAARQTLDADHYDLDKVKDRIIEYLAVRKLREERRPPIGVTGPGDAELAADAGPIPLTPADEALHEPILCFVGPPGVGKTSLGQSIARAMGRNFARMSLGGVRDEAEIRGHRRTYIGAMPGRIIQAIRRAETNDPVIMLDEIDKLAVGFQGDPAAALLEVLDPAQNHAFVDHYLGVPFDLSKVLFITTANTLSTIPAPLLDRMEVLELAGYTESEKLEIARRFLVPKQRLANGLREGEIALTDDAIRRIIRDYTREAGVRALERQIASVCRKAARAIAEGRPGRVTVDAAQIPEYLGRPRFFAEVAERIDRPGVATGLAWTPTGGDVLFVEATIMPGREGQLILTGMLGDVMRESAQAALSYLRSTADRLRVDPMRIEGRDVHIHVPAGAIPKDGPSAGITMAVALASAMCGRPVRSDIAMTGEITLRGKVLPVGGIKEKMLAAHRAGVKTVILPQRNEGDLEDVPAEVKRDLRFVCVDTIEQALTAALELEPARIDLEIAARDAVEEELAAETIEDLPPETYPTA